MQNLTPDWEEVYELLITKLDDVAEELDLSVDLGADPRVAVTTAIQDLQEFLAALCYDHGIK